ncbi:hypothetical protein PMAYCL1PPCAC_29230 [Pristionchus mayeri]|uniref:BZIP domain-containing protein n=1 Tax=Pristionchus mayeri TaxID=1317129 RepID=A0AAN5DBB9_9BILA|nr:hypothetical protein PMAYCL1PPCAC_29230 [Pristionchus mayeri]
MYPSSSSSDAQSLLRPSSFSFDTSSSSSVIVSTPSTLPPPLPQPDLPERTPDTPSYANYYSNDQYPPFFPPNNGYSFPFLLSLDMRQQSESNSCVGTPLNFFQTDFPLQLNPLSQSPFPSSVYQSTGSAVIPSMGVPVRRTGGRRPKEMDNLYDQDIDHEEVEKKSKRRQRNKEAAARCRARRLNLMNELQDKVDQYKRESKSKAEEIKNLSEKVQRLHTFLRNHECKVSAEERQKILNNCGVTQNLPLVNTNTRYVVAPSSQSHRSLPPPSIPPSHHQLATSTHSHIEQPVENYPAQLRANQPRDSTDWIPQYEQQQRGTKRGHEEMSGGNQFGEQKQPKIELMENERERDEKTLTQINGNPIGNDDLERPTDLFKLDMTGQTPSGTLPLTTPSREFAPAPSFPFPMLSFGSGLGGPSNILGQSTGLTPVANVSTMSTFSLGTPLGNNDLKNL